MSIKRVYGHIGRTCLQATLNRDLCTQDSLAAYLSSLGMQVDRSQVARWTTGLDHVPADVLVHLANHTGEPTEVLGFLAQACGCEVVRLPEGALTGRQVTTATLQLGAAVGHLQAAVADATDPDSEDGAGLSRAERDAIRDHVAELAQQLADLQKQLDSVPLKAVRKSA